MLENAKCGQQNASEIIVGEELLEAMCESIRHLSVIHIQLKKIKKSLNNFSSS